MMENIILTVVFLLVLAALVQAYSWGWQAGHDVHHNDDERRRDHPKPPDQTPTSYV